MASLTRSHEYACDCERCNPENPRCDECDRELNDDDECRNDDCPSNLKPDCMQCDGTGEVQCDIDHFSPERGHWTTASTDFCDCEAGDRF